MTSQTTAIRNLEWIVAWDGTRHVYRGGDLVFRGQNIVSVGGVHQGPVDREIDGRKLMASPGLVDLHAHPSFETMLKGVTEEAGSPNFYMSSLYEYLFLFEIDDAGMKASLEAALAELLQSGVTTLCDVSLPHAAWLDTLAASGIRGFAAPMFRSGRWFTPNGHAVEYEFDIPLGRGRLEAALSTVRRARAHPCGRLDGIVAPAQIDTCDEGLLREAAAEARAANLPLQIHASQSVVEFNEIMRRSGLTPVGWLGALGLLGPDMTIAHGIFLDHADWVARASADDLPKLAETGTSVAHCPTVFARRGIALQHFARYRRAGVNLGVGTDTFPHNLIEEMRNAIYAGRIMARDVAGPTLESVFHAATIGGATALGRSDIGRLAPGARADIVLVDLSHPQMRPVRDPLRSLVFSAGERAIRDVYVDGRQVVAAGKAIGIDVEAALEGVAAAQRRALEGVRRHHFSGEDAARVLPLSLPAG